MIKESFEYNSDIVNDLSSPRKPEDASFMREARLSQLAVEHGNEPFGAVLVKNGKIVFTNENQIYTRHDPTFHGEAGLIRESVQRHQSQICMTIRFIPAVSRVLCAVAQWSG